MCWCLLLADLTLEGLSNDATAYSDWSPWLALLMAGPHPALQSPTVLRLLDVSRLPASMALIGLAAAVHSMPHLQVGRGV